MPKLYSLLFRAMLRQPRQYIGYITAITLSVSTFFSFGFFMTHPSLKNLMTSDYTNAMTQLFAIGQIGVAVFAIFFVLFFQRFLLRLRSRQLGVLRSLGMAPNQLGKMMLIELTAIASIGILGGFVVSIAQTVALLWMISYALNVTRLDFSFSIEAISYGLIFFLLLFGVNAWMTWRYVHTSSIKVLALDKNRSQLKPMKLSKIKALGGIACLVLGYLLAIGFQDNKNSVNIFPNVFLVSIGTYLFYSQILIIVLRFIHKHTTSGYKFLSTSRLSYRARDLTQILTLVTLLSAGAMTLIGVALAIITQVKQIATSPDEYQHLMQFMSLVLFVFFFIGLLFFIAAASTLYVKLFTQIDEDRSQAKSLQRLGISSIKFQRILWGESALLIFIPLTVATVHASVAMTEFTTKVAPAQLSDAQAWTYFMLLTVIFAVIFTVFYVVAGMLYSKQLNPHENL